MSTDRRSFLTSGIALAAGVVGATAPAAAGDADPRKRNEGELPNRRVPVTDVHPFPGQPSTARTGEWLWHNLAWVGNDPQGLRDIVATTEDIVHVDGERIDDAQQYWGDVEPSPPHIQRDYVIYWKYYTPPKQPGIYPFSWQVRFGNGNLGPVHSNPYEVVEGGGGSAGAAAPSGGTMAADSAPVDGVRQF